MVTATQFQDEIQLEVPQHRIEGFVRWFGEAHLKFACHAALPISLTPELLYTIWANFQQDTNGNSLDIPWIAVSDFLLSGLCEEVGNDMYEVESETRELLIQTLEEDISFGKRRIWQLAQFLEIHVQSKLESDDPDLRDWARAQRWTALAYRQPETAAQELFLMLSNVHKTEPQDIVRISGIVETLRNPLAKFQDLLAYARGMTAYAHGDFKRAEEQFFILNQISDRSNILNLFIPKSNTPERTYFNNEKPASKKSKQAIKHRSFQLYKIFENHWPLATATTVTAVLAVYGMQSRFSRVFYNSPNTDSLFSSFELLSLRAPTESTQASVPDNRFSESEIPIQTAQSSQENIAEAEVNEDNNSPERGIDNSSNLDESDSVRSDNSGFTREVDIGASPTSLASTDDEEISDDDGDASDSSSGAPVSIAPVSDPVRGSGSISETTLIFFEASIYTVRIIERPGESIFMTVYNRATGVQRPNGRPARVLSTGSSGVLTYASEDLANGQSATYIVRIFGDNSAELEAISTTGATLIQDSGTVSISNVPPGIYPPQEQTTIIAFEGRDFITRVFERAGGTFMTVFDRPAARTILEQQRASIEAPRSENDEWQSYVSYGSYRGVPATYHARTNSLGQAQLEIFNRNNGALLAQEGDTSAEAPNYIVAVPAGFSTLDRVREVYPEAYLDRSDQGDFVNAGAFASREAASVRVSALRSEGLDARVLYRP